jgi:hypothetical protein
MSYLDVERSDGHVFFVWKSKYGALIERFDLTQHLKDIVKEALAEAKLAAEREAANDAAIASWDECR